MRTLLQALALSALVASAPAHALPTLRAPLTVALQADVDHSGSVTCGDVLRYTLSVEPQSEFGTDLQNVAFDIVPDTNLLFDPASVVAVNSNQTVQVAADPLGIHVDFGRVCNSSGCPGPPLSLRFDGQIRVVNTGTAVSIQGQVSGTNFATTATDGTPNASIDPTVSPYPACPPTVSLRATKTYALVDDRDRDGAVDPGDAIRYTVQVQNTSSFMVRGVRFDSGVDPNSSLLVGSVTTSRGSISLGNTPGDTSVRVDVRDMAAGAAATITFDVRIATPFPAAASQVSCQGTVSSTAGDFPPFPTDDPSTPAPSDPTRTPIDFDPDLALSKSDGGALAAPGQIVTYTLGISNLSSRQAAENVSLSEMVPPHSTFSPTGSSPGWNCLGPSCTLIVGSVAPSGSLTRLFAVRIDDPLPAGTARFDNTARVGDDGENGPEPNYKNNVASDSTPLDSTRARPDLAIAKDDGGAHVRPGEVVTYTLSYSNRGNLGASGVVLRETVPARSTFEAAASSTSWSCADGSPPGTVCTFTVGTLAGGSASGSARFGVRAASQFPAGVTALTNSVHIGDDGANGPDADPANNDATDQTPLDGLAPDLRVTKTLDPTSGNRPGEILLWRFHWENRGNQDAFSVNLKDPIPAHTAFVAKSSSPGWTCPPAAQVLCSLNVGTVVAGGSGDALLALRIDPLLPAGVEVISNCAEIGAAAGLRGASTCADAPIDAAPDLALTKDDGGITARPGQTVVYTLRYQNHGTQDARGVLVEETTPLRTTLVASASTPGWTCTGGKCKLAIGEVAAGASGSALFAVRLDASIPAGVTQIVNTAIVGDDGSSGSDPDHADNLASDVTPLSGTGPAPSAQLAAALQDRLVVDHGVPGLADVGDHILYSLIITNISSVEAMDVVFQTGFDPRTTLITGSVTANPGTVIRGNGAHDATVEVRLASMPAGSSLLVTFEVTVDVLGTTPIRCQGEVLAGNAPSGVTDDPDTPLSDDPTLTPIAYPTGSVIDIPTLSGFGLASLLVLLVIGAVPRLRRHRDGEPA